MSTNQILYVLLGIALGVFAVPYVLGMLNRQSS